ncbi:hypothetical protein GSI_11733 [Ganoderma sinense ZZ0214-1]|uniref:Uncharacterized protein n=1 Tax=Ganoderma sinense ZZ0214-1 TaxID=1077348 RepID=A0A2G8RWT4_9APHY|nr:hypothetical protein GSI_11733 [Ganoderma sinense ZZ0214-1]
MSSSSAVPQLNKIFLIGIWIETALWGVNTVVFAGVCYVLFWKSKANNSRVLGVTSLLLYLVVTLHVSASLRQELEAFIYTPSPPSADYASLYFLQEGSTFAAMKNVLYTTAVFIQDLVLIWRMYVVWARNWKIIVIPLTVELVHIGCAYAAVILLTQPNAGIYTPTLSTLGSLGWPLGAIASRMWFMGRTLSRVEAGSLGGAGRTRSNAYVAPIFTIVESGAILVAVTVTMLALYKTGNPAALMCTDIATQIAALVPYLIIVRVGLGLTHGLPNAYKSYMETTKSMGGGQGMTFAPNRILKLGTKSSQSYVCGTFSDTVTSTAQAESIALSDFEAKMRSQESLKRSGMNV